jgi:hypothetical protein
MLDLIGIISLTALAVVLVAMLVPDSGKHGPGRTRIAVGLSAWFILAAALGLAGAFASPALPVGVAVGIAVFGPVLALAGIVARTQAHGIPLTTLVAVHIGRIMGGVFLVLYAVGRLPYTFAHSAGWGDVATGVLAIPLVWAIRHRVAGWRWFTAAWNVLGLADLLAAVTLAVGSAPGSPLRFIYEPPGSGAIVTFPWVLVPAFFVPLYMLTHVAVFAHLAAPARTSERGSNPAIGPISPAARATR